MPLSEHEQRLLEQMERALSAEDPRFASTLQGSRASAVQRRGLTVAVAGLLLGVGLLIIGVLGQVPLVSVLGFVVMFAAVVIALNAWRKPHATSATEHAALPVDASSPPWASVTHLRSSGWRSSRGQPSSQQKKLRNSGTFNERMQQRWQRRRQQ